jgi:hypothetical protein
MTTITPHTIVLKPQAQLLSVTARATASCAITHLTDLAVQQCASELNVALMGVDTAGHTP